MDPGTLVSPPEQTPTQEKGPPFGNATYESEPAVAGSDLHHDGNGVDPVILATEEPVPRIVLAPISTQLKDPEVKDFGWNVPPDRVPAPLLNRLSNDDLYTLLRRFNKVPLISSILILTNLIVSLLANFSCQGNTLAPHRGSRPGDFSGRGVLPR